MSFGLTFEKLLLIGLIAVLLIGPDRLPGYAAQFGRFIRTLRDMANGAKERMREEMRIGRSPFPAVDMAFQRAFGTILDSNLTTLIAALFLYFFGAGPVRGFAVTLSIGILCSMFTSVTVTRLTIVTWLKWARPKALPI